MPLTASLLDDPETQRIRLIVELPTHLLSYLITKEGAVDFGHELRRARQERGMTVRRLAELGNTSPAAISQIETGARGVTVEKYNSLLKKTRHRLVTIPTIANTAAEVAADIAEFVRLGESQSAFREFLSLSDSLRKQEPVSLMALCYQAPVLTGSEVFDAALAALVEHWLTQAHLPVPQWVQEPDRSLSTLEYLRESDLGPIPEQSEVPHSFLRHNVLFAADALESV